jgi:hypothetical protein
MITKDDLNEWMKEYEGDVIFDGPFNYSDEQFEEFTKNVKVKLEQKYGSCDDDIDTDDFDEIICWYEERRFETVEYTLDCFVELINKYNIPKFNWED